MPWAGLKRRLSESRGSRLTQLTRVQEHGQMNRGSARAAARGPDSTVSGSVGRSRALFAVSAKSDTVIWSESNASATPVASATPKATIQQSQCLYGFERDRGTVVTGSRRAAPINANRADRRQTGWRTGSAPPPSLKKAAHAHARDLPTGGERPGTGNWEPGSGTKGIATKDGKPIKRIAKHLTPIAENLPFERDDTRQPADPAGVCGGEMGTTCQSHCSCGHSNVHRPILFVSTNSTHEGIGFPFSSRGSKRQLGRASVKGCKRSTPSRG